MNDILTFEQFLRIFGHDDIFPIDETMFYFADDPSEEEHYLGCIRDFEKPYWAGYCDIPDGAEFGTAAELLNAPIYDGLSVRDRWQNVVLVDIGGIPAEVWLRQYKDDIKI